MTFVEFIAVIRSHWAEVLATLLAFIAIWQSYRANRFARLVAEHEGSLDQPKLEIGMFGHAEITRFLILAPITPAPLDFSIPLNVHNLGSATATDIQLLVRGNEDLLPYSREWLQKEQPDASGIVVASFHAKEGLVNSVMYRIAHLHPGMPLCLVNTALLSEPTLLQSEASFTTADGFNVKLPYKVVFSYQFDAVAFQKDRVPIAKAFLLGVLDVSKTSVADALESYWQTLSSGAKKELRPQPWWSWPKTSIQRICVVTVDEAKIVKDGPSNTRSVPVGALLISEGLMDNDGLLVPGLGVELGNFQGTLTRSKRPRWSRRSGALESRD